MPIPSPNDFPCPGCSALKAELTREQREHAKQLQAARAHLRVMRNRHIANATAPSQLLDVDLNTLAALLAE